MISMRSSSCVVGSAVSTSSVMIARTVLLTTVPSWCRCRTTSRSLTMPSSDVAVGADDQGADVVLGEEREQLAYAGVRSDRDHGRVGLGLEDVGDAHGSRR